MTTTVEGAALLRQLAADGIAVLPAFVPADELSRMREAFGSVLGRQRWNDINGYEKTEPYRHMVQNVLTLDQGFVDAALHPSILATLREYIGPGFQLVEAKGWLSLPTRRDFHGWHGDAWYDQSAIADHIPKEVKLAIYLSDVSTGYFEYVRGSHRQQAPRTVADEEVEQYPDSEIVKAAGAAGTAILFDTSGIHRQSVPMLEPRLAVFYDYHDPSFPLQKEDVKYNRYHPLLLNAALLGGLDEEMQRVLGFGDKRTHAPSYRRATGFPWFHSAIQLLHDCHVRVDDLRSRLRARLLRSFGR